MLPRLSHLAHSSDRNGNVAGLRSLKIKWTFFILNKQKANSYCIRRSEFNGSEALDC